MVEKHPSRYRQEAVDNGPLCDSNDAVKLAARQLADIFLHYQVMKMKQKAELKVGPERMFEADSESRRTAQSGD